MAFIGPGQLTPTGQILESDKFLSDKGCDYGVVAESGRILIEAAPKGFDVRAVAADLQRSIAGIENVHHMHAWSLTEARPMVTLHVKVAEAADGMRIVSAVKEHLRERYSVAHATVEIECDHCADHPPAAS